MIPNLGLNELQLLILIGMFYVLSSAQIFIAGITFNKRDKKYRKLTLAYNALLAFHFMLMASLSNSICHQWTPPSLGLWIICLDLNSLLWSNLFIAFFGILICLLRKKPSMIPEIVILVLATPLGLNCLNNLCHPGLFMIIETSYFIFRCTSSIINGLAHAKHHLSFTAPVDTIQTMPDGLAYFEPSKSIIFANDAMRATLTQLGISTDYSTSAEILREIESAGGTWISNQKKETRCLLNNKTPKVIELQNEEAIMFSTSQITNNNTAALLIKIDVTKAWHQQRQENAVKAQLIKTETSLQNLLRETESLAEKKSIAKMRSVVHDIMGQRLSILHRLLEEELSSERIEKMINTIRTMMDDIEKIGHADPKLELESIVEAFKLVGVTININSSLPDNEEIGRILVNIIRESTTNAVRHAHAQAVNVQIAQSSTMLTMKITNTNESPSLQTNTCREKHEGSGIQGMREALKPIKGNLEIIRKPLFTVIVRIPL